MAEMKTEKTVADICKPAERLNVIKLQQFAKKSYAEKLEIHAERQQQICDFIFNAGGYTHQKVITKLLNVSHEIARKLIKKMVRQNVLAIDSYKIPFGGLLEVYYLTNDYLCSKSWLTESYKAYVPKRLKLATFEHAFQVQLCAINYLSADTELDFSYQVGWKKQPDCIVHFKSSAIAIEVELHVKSTTRMRKILGQHFENIHQGKYAAVHYFVKCPEGFQTYINSFKTVDIFLWQNQKITDEMRDKIKIFDVNDKP